MTALDIDQGSGGWSLQAPCSTELPPPSFIPSPGPAGWPTLKQLALSREEKSERASGIGGSDANIILSGDGERILKLWRQKRSEEAEEDLTGILPVMLGSWTEAFNRQWFETMSGQLVGRCGESYRCRDHLWRRCTLDGLIEPDRIVWEAKHTNAFTTRDQVLERYMPQLQHNMSVMKAERAILSVIFGNHKFEIIEVGADWLYQQELLEAERRFWDSMISGDAPVAADSPPLPKALGTREVCFDGNNAWASAAADWLKNREAAKAHGLACASIKQLVEEDVARAFGHRVEAKRSKSGAITIREMAA
jgi:predicted phage-related endonuclease